MNTLHRCSLVMLSVAVSWCSAQKIINVNYGVTEGKIKELMGVNLGPDSRTAGYHDAGITMVRMHDYHGANDYPLYSTFWKFDQDTKVFTTLNSHFNPLEPDHYTWADFDAKVGALVQDGFVPYIRLGVSAPNPHYVTVPYTPPFDIDSPTFERFASLCKRTVMHCNADWANGTHHQVRYWEVWNEPDGLFWKGSAVQFDLMYRTVYDSLKAFDPQLKIGAPGVSLITTLNEKKEYSDFFLANLVQNKGRLDFYSWHLYGIKNPYALNYFADYFRDKLDRFGFKETESHITEINNTLDSSLAAFTDSGRGAAYYASLLITAQRSAVDKLFWHQGNGFFHVDVNGQPQPTWSGLGLKAYNMLVKNSRWQLASSGDEIVARHWQSDTTNVVSLAARSEDGNQISVLVANYSSPHSSFAVQIHNLPWQSKDSVTVLTSVVQEPKHRLTTAASVIAGSPSLTIPVADLAAPAVVLLRLVKNSATAIQAQRSREGLRSMSLCGNYPNPFNDETIIHFNLAQSEKIELDIYDLYGTKTALLARGIWPQGEHKVKWNAARMPSGIYFYRLRSDQGCLFGKMTLLH